jgi:CheY-like chemotaxis protein
MNTDLPSGETRRASVISIEHARIRKINRDAVEYARETIAHAHQALDNTRRLLKAKAEILQYNRARRERKAEQAATSAATAAQGAIPILLIEDDPTDVTFFCYAVKASALPYQVTVLKHRSAVEAFVRKAANREPRFDPQMIIIECQMAGMEADDIVAAIRMVPAYHQTPIILFSSLAEAEGQRRCLQCGATAFVYKPGELEAFLTAVATMVRHWGGEGDDGDPSLKRKERVKSDGDKHEADVDGQ